jgi:hypothetical protein
MTHRCTRKGKLRVNRGMECPYKLMLETERIGMQLVLAPYSVQSQQCCCSWLLLNEGMGQFDMGGKKDMEAIKWFLD